MEIRTLTADDLEAVLDLWQVAFGRNDPASRPGRRDWFLKHPGWVRGAFLKGRLASVLRRYPFAIHWGGQTVPMGGVASVATAVEHRRRGLARALMLDALGGMAAEGVGWSGLYPFSGPFYRRYGWARCHADLEWEADLEALPSPTREVEPLDPADWRALDPVYRAWASTWNLPVVRDGERWQRRLGHFGQPSLLYGCRGEEGRLEGYLHLELAGTEPGVRVLDFAWTAPGAGRSLLGALRGFSGQARRFRWSAPAGQALLDPDELSGPPTLTLRPGMMLRVVDVEAALGTLPAPPGEGQATIQVADDLVPENEGVFTLSWTGGALEVRRAPAREPEVRVDVRGLAQLVSGFRGAGPVAGPAQALAALAGGRGTHGADFF